MSSDDEIVYGYKKAAAKGMLKVMAKMGISTLQSYKGAQIFEAVGLADEIINQCFVGTASRVQGVNFEVLFAEMLQRHHLGYPLRSSNLIPVLPNPGDITGAARRRAYVGPHGDFNVCKWLRKPIARTLIGLLPNILMKKPLDVAHFVGS